MNKAFYKLTKTDEPKAHRLARKKIEGLLTVHGAEIEEPIKFTFETDLGERTYEPDIYALTIIYKGRERIERFFIVEIDGPSHNGDGKRKKDSLRDKSFESVGIPTVRFEIEEVLGRFALSETEIFQRILDKVYYTV